MIGLIATILLAIAYTPQLLSVIRTKKTENLSPKTYLLLSIGLVFWCIHAVINKDTALFISSFISLLQSIIILFYLVK